MADKPMRTYRQEYPARAVPGRLAQDALLSQSACNSGGLIESLREHLQVIRRLARKYGKGTDWINKHPVIRLFVYQLHFLSEGEGQDAWKAAIDVCSSAVTEEKQPDTQATS